MARTEVSWAEDSSLQQHLQTNRAKKHFWHHLLLLLVRVGFCLSILVVVAEVGLLFLNQPITVSISPSAAFDSGNGDIEFRVPIALYLIGATPDNGFAPMRSQLKLTVNGESLLPHALHSELFAGQPGFSHGGGIPGWVRFSLGPNKTAADVKRIEVEHPLLLPRLLVLLAVLGIAVAIPAAYGLSDPMFPGILSVIIRAAASRLASAVIVCGFAAYVFTTVVTEFPKPVFAGDSLTFLFDILSSLGYPYFLKAVLWASHDMAMVSVAQLAIYVLSTLILYLQLQRLFAFPPAAVLATVGLLSLSEVILFNLMVMSDALAISLFVLNVAAVAAAISTRSTLSFIMIGLTAGLAGILRPAAHFLIGGIVLLGLVWRGSRPRVFGLAMGALLVVHAAVFLVEKTLGRTNSEALWAWSTMPHVAMLFDPHKSTLRTEEAAALERAIAPFREKWGTKHTLQEMFDFQLQNTTPVQWKMREELEKTWQGTPKMANEMHSVSAVFNHAALETIRQSPLGYAKIVFVALTGAYRNYALKEYGLSSVISNLYDGYDRRATKIAERFPNLNIPTKVDPAVAAKLQSDPPPIDFVERLIGELGINAAVDAILLIVALLLFIPTLTGSGRTPAAMLGSYCLALHFGGSLLVSLSAAFSYRYGYALDVFLIIACGCAVDLCLGWIVEASRHWHRRTTKLTGSASWQT